MAACSCSGSSREQTEASARFHDDRVPIMVILAGFHEDVLCGMKASLSSAV